MMHGTSWKVCCVGLLIALAWGGVEGSGVALAENGALSTPNDQADKPKDDKGKKDDSGKKDDKAKKDEAGKDEAKKKDGDKKDGDKKDGEKKDDANKHAALNFVVKDIGGADHDLKQHYGEVILVVNTASKCGYTPQYGDFKKLYSWNKGRNFTILAFPSNSFDQEPGTNEEIKKFCQDNYSFDYPLLSKVSVKGSDICPYYKYLTEGEHEFKGEIQWNFTKFLINRKGEIVARFKHTTHPLKSKKFTEALEKALAEPLPDDAAVEKPVEMKPSFRPKVRQY